MDDLTAVAKKEGWNIVKVFTEKTSGSKTPLKKRKPILTMLEMARAGKIDVVMLHELSRLSRRPKDIDTILNELIEQRIASQQKSIDLLDMLLEAMTASACAEMPRALI